MCFFAPWTLLKHGWAGGVFLCAKTKQTMKLGKTSALFHNPHFKNMFCFLKDFKISHVKACKRQKTLQWPASREFPLNSKLYWLLQVVTFVWCHFAGWYTTTLATRTRLDSESFGARTKFREEFEAYVSDAQPNKGIPFTNKIWVVS